MVRRTYYIGIVILLIAGICLATLGDISLPQDGNKIIWNNNSQTFSIAGSSSMSESIDYIWPPADAIAGGQSLLSDASGVLSWGIPVSAASHNLMSGTHTDTTNSTPPARGSLIYGNSTPLWDELTIGDDLTLFTSNGEDAAWGIPSTFTWGVGSDFTWTFNSTGTDTTMVFSDGNVALSHGLTVDTLGGPTLVVDDVAHTVGVGGSAQRHFSIIGGAETTFFQLTNSTIGTGLGNGLEFFVSTNSSAGITNREASALLITSGGAISFDAVGSFALGSGAGRFTYRDGQTTVFHIEVSAAKEQATLIMRDEVGNQLVFANGAATGRDFDHPLQTNPTFFVQSDLNPNSSNNQWGSFHHDQEDFIIETGVETGEGSAPTTDENAIVLAPRGVEELRAAEGLVTVSNGLTVDGSTLLGDTSGDSTTINGEYVLPLVDGGDGDRIETDGAGNLSFVTCSEHAEVYRNTDGTLVINTANQFYPALDLTVGSVVGIIVDEGEAGTVTSIIQNGSDITVSANNTMIVGDPVSLNDGTGYDGLYMVNAATATTFDVTAAFVATGAGVYIKGQNFIIAKDGCYHFDAFFSGHPATGAPEFEFGVAVNATLSDKGRPQRKFANAVDVGNAAGTQLLDLLAGDRVTFLARNLTGTQNLVIHQANINLSKD